MMLSAAVREELLLLTGFLNHLRLPLHLDAHLLLLFDCCHRRYHDFPQTNNERINDEQNKKKKKDNFLAKLVFSISTLHLYYV
jgi:hypothetical protein